MKTNAKHFKIFKAECEKWIDKFNLRNWCVDYYHKDDSDDTYAWSRYSYAGRAVDLCLNCNWKREITEHELRLSAFHEVCEVLLYSLRYLGESRYLAHGDTETEVHNIIRRLEYVLWKK